MTPKGKPRKEPTTSSTIVNIVIDRSGSMQPNRSAVVSSFNEYIQTLKSKKTKGDKMLISITTFNDVVSLPQKYDLTPLEDVPEMKMEDYNPDGMTAMYDAIGASMKYVEDKLSSQRRKPAVLFVILTDGEENSSREYTGQAIKDMITEREKRGNFSFIYLGANQNAWAVGQSMGINAQNTATFAGSATGVKNTMHAAAMASSAFMCSVRGNVSNAGDFRAFSSDKTMIGDDEDEKTITAMGTSATKMDFDNSSDPKKTMIRGAGFTPHATGGFWGAKTNNDQSKGGMLQ